LLDRPKPTAGCSDSGRRRRRRRRRRIWLIPICMWRKYVNFLMCRWQIWHSEDYVSWYTRILIIKANEMNYFSNLFWWSTLYISTDLLSIITSHNTVYTAIGICHASYVGRLLARSGCTQCWDSWWWTVDLSETYRVLHQNKFEKQCISLAFIIRIVPLTLRTSYNALIYKIFKIHTI
jgi:hypothetical protein